MQEKKKVTKTVKMVIICISNIQDEKHQNRKL